MGRRAVRSRVRVGLAAGVAGVVVAAGLFASPAVMAAEDPLPDEVDDPFDEPEGWAGEGDEVSVDPAVVAAEEAAMAAALATGEPVEVDELTTERELVTADPDTGSFVAEVSAFPERVRDESGEWVDVDTTLVLAGDGVVRPVATSVELEFSGGGSAPLARITDGGEWLEFGWDLGELPAPELDGSVALYRDVFPDVDLVLEAGVEDFSQYLVVNTPEAAANLALAAIELPVATSGGLELTDDHGVASGGVVAADAAGEPVLWVPEPRIWDSTGREQVLGSLDGGPGEDVPAVELIAEGPEARSAVMDMTVVSDVLRVVPDRELLNDPETVFPVVIDPTVSRYHTHCKMVWSNGSEPSCSTSTNGQARVGYDGWSDNKKARVFYRFSNSTFRGRQILTARFTHRQVHSPPYSCGGTYGPAVELSWSGSASSSTTWSNQPSGASATYSTTARSHGHRNHCSGYTTTEWNAKAAVERAVSRDDSTLTIRLRSTNESNRDGWRQFSHVTDASPRLRVEYNRAPGKPSGLRTTSPASTGCPSSSDRPWFNDNTPVLRATIKDPDGDQVRGRFSYSRRGSDGTWGSWTYHNTAYASSGTERSWQLPTLSDGRYRWRVRGYDGLTYGPYSEGPDSKYCYFEINTTRPPTPSVQIGAPYEFGWWLDPDGLPRATLTVGNGGDSSVERVFWRIGGGSTQNKAISGSTTINFYPTYGVDEVRVWLRDKAGNVGPETVKTLKIMSPRAQHAWMFNDDDGQPSLADIERPTGMDLPLTLGAGVEWTTGNLDDESGDHALWFPGTGEGATTPGPAIFPMDSFTVAARVKLDELSPDDAFYAVNLDGPGYPVLKFGYHPSGGEAGAWKAYMHSTGEAGGNYRALDTELAPEESWWGGEPDWQHLAVVYDAAASKLHFYVDGEPAASRDYTFDWATEGPLRIGRGQNLTSDGGLNGSATGAVDDVVTFDAALNSGQIRRLMNSDFLSEIQVEVLRNDFLKEGLAAGWQFDEAEGETATDWSGNGHHLTLSELVGWGDGVDGSGLSFNDDLDAFAETTWPVIDTRESFSLSTWVRFEGDEALATAGVASQSGETAGVGHSGMFLSFSESNDAWRFGKRLIDGGGNNSSVGSTPPVHGQWVHLVGVFEARDLSTCLASTRRESCGEYRLYVDGVLQNVQHATEPWTADGVFRLGSYMVSDEWKYPFIGNVDEVRVYERVLSPAEIQFLRREVQP